MFWLEFYNYLSNKTQRDEYIQILRFCDPYLYGQLTNLQGSDEMGCLNSWHDAVRDHGTKYQALDVCVTVHRQYNQQDATTFSYINL